MSRWLTQWISLPVRILALVAMGSLVWQLAPGVFASADAGGQTITWWASRAFGITAYIAIWLSMLFGMLVGARGIEGLLSRKVLMDLHQQWSLAAVLATLLHVLTIVGHAVESHVAPIAAIVPFTSKTLTGEVALGTIAFWGLALISISSWLRSRISYGLWRMLHALVFGTFLLALLHGILAGTDSGSSWAQWMYLVTASLFAGTLTARIAVAIGRAARPTRDEDSELQSGAV